MVAIYVEEGGEWQTPKCYSNAPGFPWGLFGYGLAKLLFALRYTYLTRNVYTRYNETKAVLFAVYNVLIGLVLGLVSYAITGLQREGAIILLLIALAVASFGTSASVVGSRVVYALVDITSSKPRTSTGSAGSAGIKNDSGSYEQDPQILVRRGLKALPDVSMAKTGNSEPIPTNSNDGSKKKDDDYVCQGDLIGYEASVRQRSVVLWLSKWYSCLVIIGNVNTEPNIIISIYEDITGSGKLVPTRTMTLIGEQVGDVVFLEKNTVKIDTTRGVFDVDFPSASLAAQFVEAYQKRMGKPKFDNKSSAPDTKESGGEVV
ncbi:hypothetical protein HK102_002118 [Quaeritorhiza haematococci]|nr:hypothetical protein HK102_002118 [Quaeritorhiza haematococci]